MLPRKHQSYKIGEIKPIKSSTSIIIKIEAQLTKLKDFLIKAVDAGVTVSIDFIMNAIKQLNLDPIVMHLIAGGIDILGNGILSSLDKGAIWFIWAAAELALLAYTEGEHMRIEGYVLGVSQRNDPDPLLPGRGFFPSGRAWTEAYCESFGGCVPAW